MALPSSNLEQVTVRLGEAANGPAYARRMPDGTVVALVEAQAVLPLRRDVLRPGRPADDSVFCGDDHPLAVHVAIRFASGHTSPAEPPGTILAVGTVYPYPPPWEPARTYGWRIRGMATRPQDRGRGLGRSVLDRLVVHVADHGGGVVWCNARVAATGLYRRAGFEVHGEEFEVPGIGAHLRMWRTVEPTPVRSG
jgi:ribosomal protein S18 acetylase RimI-like enzyme